MAYLVNIAFVASMDISVECLRNSDLMVGGSGVFEAEGEETPEAVVVTVGIYSYPHWSADHLGNSYCYLMMS